jgi:hypothetical protein
VHLRPDDEIRHDIVAGVLPPSAETTGVEVEDGVVTLTGRVGRWSLADRTVRATRQVAGVVDVIDRLEYDADDGNAYGPGIVYGVA